jgi:GxxExxY protein
VSVATGNNLIEIITELAKDIFRTLGSGHSEMIYQRAMEVGLRLSRIRFDAQRVIPLSYKDHYIGEEYLDLLVEANSMQVIVELKAALSKLGPAEEQQLRNYMQSLRIDHGVLINFPQAARKALEPDIKIITPEGASSSVAAER